MTREEVLTNEMTFLPPHRAGHDPCPRSTPEVKSVAPITVSDCSDSDVESEQTRTPWLEGPQMCGR